MTFASVVRRSVRRTTSAIAGAPPWAVLLASWLVLIVYAYPGLITLDSLDHLAEARGGHYTDNHPPAISLLWKATDAVIAGPFGMLVVQSAGFVVGLYGVLRRTLAPRRAAWAAALIFVFPPVMLPFAVIWKDCTMAAFLALGLAAMPAPRRWVRVAGLLALGAATAFRYNAFGATFPIILLMFEWRPGMRWVARYAIAFAAWLGVTVGAFAFNAAITDHEMHPWHSTLALFDIVGTLAHVDGDIPDDELRPVFEGTELHPQTEIHAHMREVYTPRNFLKILTHPTDALWTMPFRGAIAAPAPKRAAIARAFEAVVTAHPWAYAAHRLAVMREVLGLSSAHPWGTVIARDIPHAEPGLPRSWFEQEVANLGLSVRWSPLQRAMSTAEQWIDATLPIFVPWIYLVVSWILLPLARTHRDVLATLASGLVFESSLLFLAASPDYRYSHWMVICTLIAVVELTARRMRPPQNATSA